MPPTRVHTGSRLHLGLLSLPDASMPRAFGGVGLMIDEPAVEVAVESANQWRGEGPSAERALDYARRLSDRPLAIRVERCPAEHVGLGTGTQLAMAVGTAVRTCLGRDANQLAIAADLGRGLRSGLGVHGFVHGGFLVDGGKGPTTSVAPLVCRHAVPDEWAVLLVRPRDERGLAGAGERAAFAQLATQSSEQTDALCRLVLLGLVPALCEHDLPAFGDAVFEFNRRAGLSFKAPQGGEYSSPIAAEIVAKLRELGLRGVGQSSWGPTIFAIDERDRLTHAAGRIQRTLTQSLETTITSPRNRGWEN